MEKQKTDTKKQTKPKHQNQKRNNAQYLNVDTIRDVVREQVDKRADVFTDRFCTAMREYKKAVKSEIYGYSFLTAALITAAVIVICA